MIDLVQAATSGVGVYSIYEAARYAKMHPNTLRKWFGFESGRARLRSGEIDSPDFKVISFLAFIEALAIRSLRVDHKISYPKIRQAIATAQDRYGIGHPFAHERHRTVVSGSDIHIGFEEDPNAIVQITGKNIGQKSHKVCIERYMEDLDFNKDGLAAIYYAFRFKGQEVVMNPKMHFGDPILRESGYTAETLYRAAVAEGSIEQAAQIYDVKIEAVDAAYRYCNQELAAA